MSPIRERENLYFVAIIPHREIRLQIDRFKLDFANRFDSSRALKVMSHITLKAPFKLPASRHEELLGWFQSFTSDSTAFEMELKDFGAFHNEYNPVVYVDPVVNEQLLSLQAQIIASFLQAFPETPIAALEIKYKPHMTVAYRDLNPEQFRKAWKEYQTKSYSARFDVSNFYLLQHDGKKWNIAGTRSLKKNGEQKVS